VTEADWDSCTDSAAMLEFPGTTSNRKLGLFAVACCRHVQHLLTKDYVSSCPTAIEVHEQFAEGLVMGEELWAAKSRQSGDSVDAASAIAHPGEADYYAAANAVDAAEASCDAARAIAYDAIARLGDSTVAAITANWQEQGWQEHARWEMDEITVANVPAYLAAYAAERSRQASLLRCVFGNPVRQNLPLESSLLIRGLAHAAYDDLQLPEKILAPDNLAVLADALEESGCTDAALLEHLRSPGPHVRGCFALDTVLGRL
jgi:hypothetical protein